jgi:hypothetical protein
MANLSIKNAFSRVHQHMVSALSGKVDKTTTINGKALSDNITISKSDINLGNVENKSSATIRGELTSSNVTSALGFTPASLDSSGKVLTS